MEKDPVRTRLKITITDPLTGKIRRFFERPDGLFDETIVDGHLVQWLYAVQLDFMIRLLVYAAAEGMRIQYFEEEWK